MTPTHTPFSVAVLDDFQRVALSMADWSAVQSAAQLDVYQDHLVDAQALISRLKPYTVVCVMRERTPLTREILSQLPNLRLICSTGGRNASIDLAAAAEHNIEVKHTGYSSTPTIEYVWAFILAQARNIAAENASVRAGGWQLSVGEDMAGKTLGILGLGNIGTQIAKIAGVFGMHVIAWSQNLTPEAATAAGARWVSKEQLLRDSDFVTIHLVLSGRTRGLIGAAELALMKPTARLINTSRGPLVDEIALIDALKNHRIAGAAVDVFDVEPLPSDHPFRRLDNVLATPHLGYVTKGLYQRFYGDTVANIVDWLAARPR